MRQDFCWSFAISLIFLFTWIFFWGEGQSLSSPWKCKHWSTPICLLPDCTLPPRAEPRIHTTQQSDVGITLPEWHVVRPWRGRSARCNKRSCGFLMGVSCWMLRVSKLVDWHAGEWPGVRAVSGNPQWRQIHLNGLLAKYINVCVYTYTHTCLYVHTAPHPHGPTNTHTPHKHPPHTEHRELFREGKSAILRKLHRRVWRNEGCSADISRKNSQLPREAEIQHQAGWRMLRVCYVYQARQ